MLPKHETPSRLRPELTEQPQQMISEFCDQFDLADSHAMLWRMTLAFFGAEECDELDRHQRSQYLFFYQQLAALMEAAYLMDENNVKM
jgi:hypothetical protein